MNNGVSSTRSTSVAAIDLLEGDVRQLRFVEDDTLTILWSSARTSLLMSSRLLVSLYVALITNFSSRKTILLADILVSACIFSGPT